MPTIEEVVDAAVAVAKKRDARIIEVSQAVSAAADSLRESSEAEEANVSEDAAISSFKDAAIAYGKEGTGPTIEEVLAFAQAVFEARGKRVIEVEQAVAAMEAAVREQAEADSANVDEDAAISDLKDKASSYSKE